MKNQAGPVPNSLYEHDHLVLFVQTPFDSASTGNEEENKAEESGQLAFVQRRKEIGNVQKLWHHVIWTEAI